ncbi:MAG: T9SS type A sorting domain-containing protein [Ignavibacteria bacterium]|nr:T9SS type A sorting domain-containing protein [Ignavibacteria bacterium]
MHHNYDAIDFTFIFRTTNGGNSWVDYALGPNGGYSFYFINERKGWAAGIQNRIYNTGDGGITWNRPNLLPSNSYTSIFFIDSLTGWTVGDRGTILKTTTGGVLTSFTNQSTETPDKYFLSQNYPNPFNPGTIISYSIPVNVKSERSTSQGGSKVKLIVYDILGNEVVTLVNERKNAGSYEVEFDGSKFSSGIYFYSLTVDGNLIDTKKMILLK